MSGEQAEEPTAELDERGEGQTRVSPRSLRVMAALRWALLVFVTLAAVYAIRIAWAPKESSQAHFYCPMHPEIVGDEGEECPICFMRLEPIPAERQSSAGFYCPMHPEIVGEEGEECPICFMHLEPIPVERRGATEEHGDAPEGLSTVTLDEAKQAAIGIALSPVVAADNGTRLRVPAVVEVPDTGRSEVRVRTPGFVEEVLVGQSGVRVQKGQVLARVFSPELYRAQQEYLAARQWANGPTGLATSSREGLLLLGMDEQDVVAIEGSGQALRSVPIRALSRGVVTTFNAVLGSRASPEMVLYEIADLSHVWVVASVAERDAVALHVGDPLSFVTGNESSTGRIDLIEPLLDGATRTLRVRARLANRDGSLRPGQFGEVDLTLPGRAGLFVPRDALVRTGSAEYVYLALPEGVFAPTLVQSGRTQGETVEILSGLTEGAVVVSRGSFMLDSESRLQTSLRHADTLHD